MARFGRQSVWGGVNVVGEPRWQLRDGCGRGLEVWTLVARRAWLTKPHENALLGVFVIVALATALLLHHTSQQPHVSSLASEEGSSSSASSVKLTPAQATKNFPATDVSQLRSITQGTLTKLQSGDQAGATASVDALETTWDDDQKSLQPLDGTVWTFYDGEIDDVLTSLRAPQPDVKTETAALHTLITSFGG